MSNTKAVLQNADLSKNEISNQVQESAGDNLHPSDPNAKTANACPEQNGKENSVEKGIDLIYLNEEEEDDDNEEGMENSQERSNADLSADEKMAVGSDEADKPDGLLGFKYKRVLKYNSPKSCMEPLPEGWTMITHTSGIPVYLHKKSKVVTWSRPYCLLSGHILNHKVPVDSIPCLHYVKNRQKIMQSSENSEQVIPPIKNETENYESETNKIGQTTGDEKNVSVTDGSTHRKVILHDQHDLSLDNKELQEYLSKRFEFETLEIPRFKKWSQRRKFNKNMRAKVLEEANMKAQSSEEKNSDDGKPSNVNSPKVITLSVEQEGSSVGFGNHQKFVLNTNGKPMICILHEYAQRMLRVQPKYIFNVREDSNEPFEATIKLNEKVYGTAVAINKKTAKNKAALATLEMLIPGFKGQVQSAAEPADLRYFNEVAVTDARVYELCVHTGQLLPYQLLTECLKRNQGITDTTISYDVQQGKRKSLNYTMKCGKHIVNGVARNKKIGKQLAAQQILQLLHPKIKTWSELIELYGMSLAQERARRKQTEQEIFDLKQRRGNVDEESSSTMSKDPPSSVNTNSLEPNPELLAKLRDMMLKLQETRKRKAAEQEAEDPKKAKLTPMAAAVAAGKGLRDSEIEIDS